VIVKRGEYGALLYHGSSVFSVPGLPLAEVKDPTGAGDSFAGGFLGYLAARNLATPSVSELRKAVVHGCVVASFTVQDFGLSSLQRLDLTQIAERYKNFVELTTFHEDP
jgi:sugar/nucleoside kinase (ribokinase family)